MYGLVRPRSSGTVVFSLHDVRQVHCICIMVSLESPWKVPVALENSFSDCRSLLLYPFSSIHNTLRLGKVFRSYQTKEQLRYPGIRLCYPAYPNACETVRLHHLQLFVQSKGFPPHPPIFMSKHSSIGKISRLCSLLIIWQTGYNHNKAISRQLNPRSQYMQYRVRSSYWPKHIYSCYIEISSASDGRPFILLILQRNTTSESTLASSRVRIIHCTHINRLFVEPTWYFYRKEAHTSLKMSVTKHTEYNATDSGSKAYLLAYSHCVCTRISQWTGIQFRVG